MGRLSVRPWRPPLNDLNIALLRELQTVLETAASIPARHGNTADPRQLAQHCMQDADPNFIRRMQRGDVIVADTNFGCGLSREVAPFSIKAAGAPAVIAKSFARSFFRNSINIGLPNLECARAVERIAQGDEIEVEPATGTICNLTRAETYQAEPFPISCWAASIRAGCWLMWKSDWQNDSEGILLRTASVKDKII